MFGSIKSLLTETVTWTVASARRASPGRVVQSPWFRQSHAMPRNGSTCAVRRSSPIPVGTSSRLIRRASLRWNQLHSIYSLLGIGSCSASSAMASRLCAATPSSFSACFGRRDVLPHPHEIDWTVLRTGARAEMATALERKRLFMSAMNGRDRCDRADGRSLLGRSQAFSEMPPH
jgi:hypothetical protein